MAFFPSDIKSQSSPPPSLKRLCRSRSHLSRISPFSPEAGRREGPHRTVVTLSPLAHSPGSQADGLEIRALQGLSQRIRAFIVPTLIFPTIDGPFFSLFKSHNHLYFAEQQKNPFSFPSNGLIPQKGFALNSYFSIGPQSLFQ